MTSVKLGIYSNIICRAPRRAAIQLTKIFFTTITTYFLIVKTKGCLPLYDSRFMTDDTLVVNVEGLHQSEKRVKIRICQFQRLDSQIKPDSYILFSIISAACADAVVGSVMSFRCMMRNLMIYCCSLGF